jgi:hypothetical protein
MNMLVRYPAEAPCTPAEARAAMAKCVTDRVPVLVLLSVLDTPQSVLRDVCVAIRAAERIATLAPGDLQSVYGLTGALIDRLSHGATTNTSPLVNEVLS